MGGNSGDEIRFIVRVRGLAGAKRTGAARRLRRGIEIVKEVFRDVFNTRP